MGYNIKYYTDCQKGLIRAKNQDNFWCNGAILVNEDLHKPINGIVESKTSPAFAVFDGMGGEQRGEVAANIAAESFRNTYNKGFKNPKKFLLDVCTVMNKNICIYAEEEKIKSAGTTAAVLLFAKKEIYVCNIGDTRVYQFSNNKLSQISHDHSEVSVFENRPALTQNLGIPESEFVIAPYISKGAYQKGDKYLLCSDGLTDMVSDTEIEKIIFENSDIAIATDLLMNKALEMGGYDNITIILCEVQKKSLIKIMTGGLTK